MGLWGNYLGPSIFRSTIFGIFSLKHKEEEVWPGGTDPLLLPELGCVCIPIFRPVVPFFFWQKYHFSLLKNTDIGVDILLVTLILNTCGLWVYL